MRQVYSDATARQRALLETIIGASLWYIPKPVRAWTGKISVGALQAFHPESGIGNPRLSEEHVYPRKIAARLLLTDPALTGLSLAQQFRATYGRVHLITPEENKAVQRYQRVDVFSTPDAAYSAAGINLVELSDHLLPKVKKRNREVIESILSRSVPPNDAAQ